jgi:hypothetical protein
MWNQDKSLTHGALGRSLKLYLEFESNSLRQTASTAEKLCSVVPEISEKGRVFAVFPRETGPEKIIDERPLTGDN